MSRKRLTAWALLLVVGMTARITLAAPRASMAELRAIACCIEHCPTTPRPPMSPRRCCFVDSAANHPAGTASVPSLERPAMASLGFVVAVPATSAPSFAMRREWPSLRAGPPGYRHTLELRC